MTRLRPSLVSLLTLCALASIGRDRNVGNAADEPDQALTAAEASQLFTRQIQPLLRRRCFGCHGDGEELEGDLDLRSRQAMLAGGATEQPALVPGKPEASLLLAAVLRTGDLVMPPKERNRLTSEEIEALRRWISAGAPWPAPSDAEPAADDSDAADGIAVPTSGGLSADWNARKYAPGDLWAYYPFARPVVPVLSDTGDAAHPIDAFIVRKLAEKNLEPAGRADRVTWLRRATFDLTGLPPTPEEIDAFAGDESSDAHRREIDRLLASPQYGERMAQHWLDVVRYADTGGFSNDYERPHAWRYRDYVIRSFNADKPFDRFVVEQIAGDELDPDDPEMRIAVGLLRMGPWEQTGMSVAAITRQQFLDDVTNSLGETFLAQGLSCCRCHDHKFDPLPTRDYYRIQAALATTEFAEPPTPFLDCENTTNFDVGAARIERLRQDKDWLSTDDPENDSVKRLRNKRKETLDRAATRYQPHSFRTVRSIIVYFP